MQLNWQKYLQRSRRFVRRVRLRAKLLESRAGYTIAEMSLAMMAAAICIGGISWQVAAAVELVVKADARTIALALAQAKMSQLMNNPNLSPTDQPYATMQNAGIYSGYRWKVKVNEEKINITAIAQGQMESVFESQMPDGVQNNSTEEEFAGSSNETQTLGDVPIYKIVVSIMPPKDRKDQWDYRVVSFQPIRKKKGAGEGG